MPSWHWEIHEHWIPCTFKPIGSKVLVYCIDSLCLPILITWIQIFWSSCIESLNQNLKLIIKLLEHAHDREHAAPFGIHPRCHALNHSRRPIPFLLWFSLPIHYLIITFGLSANLSKDTMTWNWHSLIVAFGYAFTAAFLSAAHLSIMTMSGVFLDQIHLSNSPMVNPHGFEFKIRNSSPPIN